MLGITMEESGISKIIALRLDQDIKLGASIDRNQDDFKDEDVPNEEGVVLPPRPPRRSEEEIAKAVQAQEEIKQASRAENDKESSNS